MLLGSSRPYPWLILEENRRSADDDDDDDDDDTIVCGSWSSKPRGGLAHRATGQMPGGLAWSKFFGNLSVNQKKIALVI